MSSKPRLCLVTPALASANNGNWQTASRWGRWLSVHYRVRLVERWDGASDDLMIALHARRSASSIEAWCAQLVRRPLLLALTGTDLYRDITSDAAAQRSLDLADRLLVLQDLAPRALPAEHRGKAVVSFQSCSAWLPHQKTRRRLRAIAVGHLRDEKSPETYFEAARLLAGRDDILLDHIGAGLDAGLAEQARALMAESAHWRGDPSARGQGAESTRGRTAAQPHYRWLGALPHAATRARIQRAHVLVHMSRMEGGAHVVMEALRSGTPVLASRVDGNVGMLGAGYRGYFEWGDARGLVTLLETLRDDPAMLATLAGQGAQRAPLFDPIQERRRLLDIVSSLMEKR